MMLLGAKKEHGTKAEETNFKSFKITFKDRDELF